jgi:2-dehydro-3-deoxygluconokinase
MTSLLSFGELLLRLSPPGDERLLQSGRFEVHVGGCEANVAAGLSQLGVAAAYCTVLPASPLAEAALRFLRAEGIDVTRVQRGEGRLGLYFLERGADLRPLRTVYDRAHSAFAALRADQFDWATMLVGVHGVHSSGIVAALGDEPLAALTALLATARRLGVSTSFDCNFRPALWGGRNPQPIVTPLMSQVDLLIGNPGAFGVMLGEATAGSLPEPPDALLDTARRLHARWGIPRIAITQRDVRDASTHAWRAWLWSAADDRLLDGGSHVVRVVDRVGGGDAFAAALLAALAKQVPPETAIRLATAAGAHKLTVPGDFPRCSWPELATLAACSLPESLA